MKNLWKVFAWAGVSAAVAVTVFITQQGWWLLVLLIPLLATMTDDNKKE